MMKVSEQIACWLVRQGVTQVFSVTGGGSMFLNQALGGHEGLRCTFMHHEQACAMAAEGYARIAGKPAVVMLTTGPGSINALNGVFGAFTDSIPMIVISGQVKRETCLSFQEEPGLRQLGDQEGPTVKLASAVCKDAILIREPQDLVTVLPIAYSLAISGRPGPVWIDIPLDIQSSTEALQIPDAVKAKPQQSANIAADCSDVIRRLQSAHRPLFIGGTGVRLAGAVDRLRQFIERHGIPLATAWTHDLIESDHPLFAGRPGPIGTRAGNFCLQNADVIVVLGSRLNIRQTSYNWDSFGKNAWICQVDIDEAELSKPGVNADKKIVSDIADFLGALDRACQAPPLPSYFSWSAWCQSVGERYAVRNEHKQALGQPLNPYLIVDRVFGHLRDSDVVACGNASACILPFQIGRLKRNQRLFSNSGSASMGYDLPAAIGAASALDQDSQRRVICFAGDGSLQMNIQELQSLKTTGLNVIVVVLNNGGYLSIWQTHENFFGRVIGATPASGVEFPDFTAVALAYGLQAATIRDAADLPVLDALLAQGGPLLLNVIVDPRQEFVPRIKSRVDECGKFVTPELDDMHPFLDLQVILDVRQSASAVRATCK
jgi:acetolactate synthase I/II/III large subunit